TRNLAAGGSITFNGIYFPVNAGTGTIIVATDIDQASFTVSGPATYTGTGKIWTQSDAPLGIYTIVFNAVLGYTTPSPQVLILLSGGNITFNTNYGPTPSTGTIIVNSNLTAGRFTITGPMYLTGTGGFWTHSNSAVGDYTIVFEPFPGY